jgi:hypothetical protein
MPNIFLTKYNTLTIKERRDFINNLKLIYDTLDSPTIQDALVKVDQATRRKLEKRFEELKKFFVGMN